MANPGRIPERGAKSCRVLRRGLSLVPRRKDRPQLPERERREPRARALPQRWVSWLIPVLIVLVTSAAFLPALQNQFLRWDDHKNFLGNPHYRGLGWMHLRWMWTTHLGHPRQRNEPPRPGLRALGHEPPRLPSDQSPPARRG